MNRMMVGQIILNEVLSITAQEYADIHSTVATPTLSSMKS